MTRETKKKWPVITGHRPLFAALRQYALFQFALYFSCMPCLSRFAFFVYATVSGNLENRISY